MSYTRMDDVFENHRDLIDELTNEHAGAEMIVYRIREEEDDLSLDEMVELHDTIATYQQG